MAAVLAAAMLAACGGGATSAPLDDEASEVLEAIDLDAGEQALDDCTDVGGAIDDDRDHVDPEDAPPADAMYGDHEERPAHSGPHFGIWQLPEDVDADSLSDLDERSLVHNLEHGSIVVAIDPTHPDAPTDTAAIADWARTLMDAGFSSGRAGGGIYTVTYEGIASGAPVALRAWGVALDCDAWDLDAASAFVARHYGERGQAPEKTLSPYPDDVLDDTSPQA